MEFQSYFQSYQNYFWEWEQNNDGLFLTVPNARTIAHHDHVLEILKHLSDESIPPFGSLLLAIIATNASGGESFDSVLYYVRNKVKVVENQSIPDLDAAISFLENLQLLTGFKKGKNKLLLFKTIFSQCHKRISAEKVQIILKQFSEDSISVEKIPFNKATFINDFKVFELLHKKFPTKEAILNVLQGLDNYAVEQQLEETLLEQESTSVKPPDFIEQLIQEDKTFHVGSLIKRIWSGLNIPLHHNMPSSQPLGGISDLTNKGDFDKLLISEFAQDDMVFMSRIANNEALYIQREVPPEADKFERIILIDTTLRNWGNPKAMNFATALAIAKHPKTDISCRLFVVGNAFEEIGYATVEEVVEGLNSVIPKLDCSEGLNSYLLSETADSSHEVFFITCEENVQVPAMQKVMSDHFAAIKYVVTTHYDGTVNIFRNQNKGKKHLQKMILPLETLWKRDETTAKAKGRKFDPSISDAVHNYPLHYPLPQNPIATFYLDDWYYFLTSNKSLMVAKLDAKEKVSHYNTTYIHPENYKGATILFENISIKGGGIYGLGKNNDGDLVLYYYFINQSQICYLNLNTKVFAKTNFRSAFANHQYRIFNDNDLFYLININSKEVWEIAYENDSIVVQTLFDATVFDRSTTFFDNHIRPFSYHGTSSLKSFNAIIINTEDLLQFNIHKLSSGYNNSLFLFQDRNATAKIKALRDKNKFVFPDGSEVLLDNRGMLTLVSSNPDLPNIYLPPVLQIALAMATDEEFAGNPYFYDNTRYLKKIEISEFKAKYLDRFIQQIIHYEV